MTLRNLLLFSTYFLTSAIRDTLQDTNEPIVHPEIIQLSDLVTSDNLVNLREGFNSRNVHFDNFKLKPGALGNSFLVPLCEVKDQKGNEIKTEFIKFINFNQVVLKSSRIDNENVFCTSVKFYNNDKKIHSGRSLPRRCFIFENPSTKKLFLYLLFTMIKSNKLHIQHNKLQSKTYGVDSILFHVDRNYDEPLAIFDAKLHYISERYVLVYSKKHMHISFSIKSTHDGKIELLYGNQNNECAIIKPYGLKNEGNILKYNLLKENEHTIFSEEISKQQEQLSTDKETDAESEENSEYKLNLLRIDNQNSLKKEETKNEENLKEVKVGRLSTEAELNLTKEKLKLIEKKLKLTEEKKFITEEESKRTKEKFELSSEENKTSEEKLKFITENIKTPEEKLMFTEENIETFEEALKYTNEKLIKSKNKFTLTEETPNMAIYSLYSDDQKLNVNDKKSKTEKQREKMIISELKTLEEKPETVEEHFNSGIENPKLTTNYINTTEVETNTDNSERKSNKECVGLSETASNSNKKEVKTEEESFSMNNENIITVEKNLILDEENKNTSDSDFNANKEGINLAEEGINSTEGYNNTLEESVMSSAHEKPLPLQEQNSAAAKLNYNIKIIDQSQQPKQTDKELSSPLKTGTKNPQRAEKHSEETDKILNSKTSNKKNTEEHKDKGKKGTCSKKNSYSLIFTWLFILFCLLIICLLIYKKYGLASTS